MILYASLTGPLLGIYYCVECTDEIEARVMLNTSSLKKLWCSMYTYEETRVNINKYGGMMFHGNVLDYDSTEVSRLRTHRAMEATESKGV